MCPVANGVSGLSDDKTRIAMEPKRVKLELAELDGNAYFLLGAFSNQARREGWTPQEINTVLQDAKRSDYDHLLQVLIAHCDTPSDYEYDEDEEE